MGDRCDVVVHFAMAAEAAPLVVHLGLKELASGDRPAAFGGLPAVVYAGGDAKTVVVVNGPDPDFGVDCVGTVNAALTAAAYVAAYKPAVVLNAGTAGGFRRHGGAVGDVYVAEGFVNHDRRVAIPGFDAWGVGRTKAKVDASKLAKELGFKTGLVSTGNSLDCREPDEEMLRESGAAVKEMEAAAIDQVCRWASVPLVSVKAITDIVDGDRPTAEEFMQNLGAASAALQAAVPKVIDYVTNAVQHDAL